MKRILVASSLLMIILLSSIRPRDSMGMPPDQGAPGVPQNLEGNELAVKNAVEAERAKISPLRAQERNEVAAVNADKATSTSNKRIALKKIRKNYLDRRNVIRLRIRTELRARLKS